MENKISTSKSDCVCWCVDTIKSIFRNPYNFYIQLKCFCKGAPSTFPANRDALPLQQYIHLSSKVEDLANQYREALGFARQPYLSVHLRHGSDWVRIIINQYISKFSKIPKILLQRNLLIFTIQIF